MVDKWGVVNDNGYDDDFCCCRWWMGIQERFGDDALDDNDKNNFDVDDHRESLTYGTVLHLILKTN